MKSILYHPLSAPNSPKGFINDAFQDDHEIKLHYIKMHVTFTLHVKNICKMKYGTGIFNGEDFYKH